MLFFYSFNSSPMASVGMWNEHNLICLMFESLCAALTHLLCKEAMRDPGAV